jgi:hypothetical protein
MTISVVPDFPERPDEGWYCTECRKDFRSIPGIHSARLAQWDWRWPRAAGNGACECRPLRLLKLRVWQRVVVLSPLSPQVVCAGSLLISLQHCRKRSGGEGQGEGAFFFSRKID